MIDFTAQLSKILNPADPEDHERLPNFKELPLSEVARVIAGRHVDSRVGRVKLSVHVEGLSGSRWGNRATVFLDRSQAGALTGRGWVLIDRGYRLDPVAGHFQLCVHEIVETEGHDPQHGQQKLRCTKCGTNLSVDSGD